MDSADREGGQIVLLRVAMISLLIALVLAWCLVFTRGMKLPFMLEIFTNTDKLLSAHLDFLMMTMLLFGFYCTRVPLAAPVMWAMAIGSLTNPSLFLIESVTTGPPPPQMLVVIMTSVVIATFGYGMGAITVLRWSFRKR